MQHSNTSTHGLLSKLASLWASLLLALWLQECGRSKLLQTRYRTVWALYTLIAHGNVQTPDRVSDKLHVCIHYVTIHRTWFKLWTEQLLPGGACLDLPRGIDPPKLYWTLRCRSVSSKYMRQHARPPT